MHKELSSRGVRRHVRSACAAIAASVIAVGASASAASVATASVPAATSASPITIADGCSYKTMNSGFGFGPNMTALGHGFNFFTVTFTNRAAVAATAIVFQIDFAKASRIAIPDAGTFAPGSTTRTTFRDRGKDMVFSARPDPNDGSVICTVLSARFADGTAYTSPIATTASPAP